MDRPDSAAQAAIALDIIRRPVLVWLDIVDDPIRVTSAPYSIAFGEGETGDDELDGHTFTAIDPTFVGLSSIMDAEGGSDRMVATLSGLIGIDQDIMEALGDRSRYKGRTARVWGFMLNQSLQRVGAVWDIRTGYMSVPKIVGDMSSQTIALEIESYTHFLTGASNRTYLDQAEFDPGDQSAEASLAIANGTSGAALSGAPATSLADLPRIFGSAFD